MKAQDLFTTGNHVNVQVHFFADSYMYREPKTYTIDSMSDFEDCKKLTKSMLTSSKNRSTQACQGETFWATFTPEGEKFDLFDERILVN